MSAPTIADQESTIKDSLFEFVKSNIPDADLGLIDEIVLSYVVAILEDVGSDPVFDVEGFCEMMSAYFPEFESINHATVCQWMFRLDEKLRAERAPVERDNSLIDLQMPEILPKVNKPRHDSASDCFEPPKRVHKISEKSDGGSDTSFDFSEEIDALADMFPHVCNLEIKHCLTIASGDLERATQILLHRQENGQSITTNTHISLHLSNKTRIDDNELKNRIIERYSYIDQDALAREHRPVAPKVEPKKLVRYRDNKIVSLKGERYTEVKKGDDVEDVSLKKSKKQQHCP